MADRAFDVDTVDYRLSGRTAYTNSDDPAVPASLAPVIQSIGGLSDVAQPMAPQTALTDALNNLSPCIGDAVSVFLPNAEPIALQAGLLFLLFAAPELVLVIAFFEGLVLGAQAATSIGNFAQYFNCLTSYANSGGTGGSGGGSFGPSEPHITPTPTEKIGLLEFDTFNMSDVTNWVTLNKANNAALADLSETPVNGGVPSPGSGEDEVLLDIDTVLDLASNTTPPQMVVYDAPASTSYVQMFNAMIGDHDTVISNSWSECEDEVSAADAESIDSVLAQAAASGISVFNGSGDDGSSCLDGSPNTIGVPEDSPNATSVGGTTPTFGPAMNVVSQTWWNGLNASPPTGAGGFGVSKFFSRPTYQNGFTDSSGRSVPDVAVDADPNDGLQLCQADDGGCPDGHLNGGTSMAAPEMAIETANLDQSLGSNIGNFDSAVYPVAQDPDTFTTAAEMGTDFSHVGLGAPNFTYLYLALKGQSVGAVSASVSTVAALPAPADGSTNGLVAVHLLDANGFPVQGKVVSVATTGSPAAASGGSSTTNAQGIATFNFTDTVAESTTVTVTDATDGIQLSAKPTLTFFAPSAAGAQIYGGPAQVTNDGASQATLTVYLENASNEPASGKTVSLSEGSGNAVIFPAGSASPGTTAVTNSAGDATFHATDTDQETVDFTATDVSDGNLPVPGSVAINFAPDTATCATALPMATAGSEVSAFATGFAYVTQSVTYPGNFTENGCQVEESAPAFDASGNAYVPDTADGTIHVFGPAGGTASTSNQLPDASFPAGALGQLVFGKDGSLYAGLVQSSGSVSHPEIVQLDPATGAEIKVVASTSTGLPDCPFDLAVDPLSGDLFADDECSGYAASNQISRISDPDGASPTVSDYLTTSGGNLGLAFAPDGTLYLANAATKAIDEIGGTNTTSPQSTQVATLSDYPAAVAVTSSNESGQATALDVFNFSGDVTAVDLTQSPATTTAAATGTSLLYITASSDDGCAFGEIPGTVVRVCSGTPAPAGPQLNLATSTAAHPATGTPGTFTATLSGVASPAGTAVRFDVVGANTQPSLVNAASDGSATFTYSGVRPGTDQVQAQVTIGSTTYLSNLLQVTWVQGKDTAFASMNASQHAGQVGVPATLSTNLVNLSSQTPTPIGGAPVTISLGSDQCSATTDASGNASCTVAPNRSGLLAQSAAFAGNAQFTSARAMDTFAAASASQGAVSPGGAQGYRLVAQDGGVFAFGNAPFDGSLGGVHLNAPVVGLAPTPDGNSYWLVASDGGVFSFGGAVFHGSMGGQRLNAPIIGMAATPDGGGYWLVASDGGVFSFGDAIFHGSTGAIHLNKPIVGMATTPSGNGYWLVASDGGIFSFGDAAFHGSMGGQMLNKPIVGMAATSDGGGYWLVASDGGVFNFGDAKFYGSMGGQRLNAPVVGMTATPDDGGYWLVAADGGMFTFGDANFLGSTGGIRLNKPVIGVEAIPSNGGEFAGVKVNRKAAKR